MAKRQKHKPMNGHGAGVAGKPAPLTRSDAAPVLAPAPVPRPVAASLMLSVVIPMFNEEENLKHTVDRVAETLRRFEDGPWEIIVVNDGSRDQTWRLARELAARPEYSFLRVEGYKRNRGRGYALRTGFRAARGEWIVSTDADLSYEPGYILDLLGVLREDEEVDMVIASCYMPGGQVEGLAWNRHWVSRLGNVLLSWFMSTPRQKVHTITCVFRAYRRRVLDSLELESDGKDIHLEILSKAMMLGFRFKEVPVTLRTRKRGKSKFVFRATAASHLVFALFERPIIVFGLMGVALLLAGIGALGYITWLWVQGSLSNGRPLLSLIVILFLGGMQLISFGVIGTQFVNLRKEIIKIQARLKQLSLRGTRDGED